MPYEDVIVIVKELGFKEAANKLGLTSTALKSRYYNAIKSVKNNASVV